jgi:hypothetical protein
MQPVPEAGEISVPDFPGQQMGTVGKGRYVSFWGSLAAPQGQADIFRYSMGQSSGQAPGISAYTRPLGDRRSIVNGDTHICLIPLAYFARLYKALAQLVAE